MFSRVFAHLLTRDRCHLVGSWFQDSFGECINVDVTDTSLHIIYFDGDRKSLSVSARALYDLMTKSKDASAYCALWSCAVFYDDDWELDNKFYDFIESELDILVSPRIPFYISNDHLTALLLWKDKPVPESTETVKVHAEADGSISVKMSLDCLPVMKIIAEDLWRKQL